jgi:hypothetical protein
MLKNVKLTKLLDEKVAEDLIILVKATTILMDLSQVSLQGNLNHILRESV